MIKINSLSKIFLKRPFELINSLTLSIVFSKYMELYSCIVTFSEYLLNFLITSNNFSRILNQKSLENSLYSQISASVGRPIYSNLRNGLLEIFKSTILGVNSTISSGIFLYQLISLTSFTVFSLVLVTIFDELSRCRELKYLAFSINCFVAK